MTPVERNERRLAALELTSSFDPFRCRFDGHEHLASLHPSEGCKHLIYRCADGRWEGGLAEVRAFIAYGHDRHVSAVEAARWSDLIDLEAGLRKPIPIGGELPEGLSESARILLEHIWLLVGLREPPEPGEHPKRRFDLTDPFILARPFGAAYTGLSPKAIQLAIEDLERTGLMRRVGKHHHAILWKLAVQDIAPQIIAELARREGR